MKIGYDAKRYFGNNSGLGNYSRDLVRMMAEQRPGNEYFLFSPTANSNYQVPPEVGIVTSTKPAFYWRSFGIAKDLKKLGIELFHGLSNEIPMGLKEEGIKSVVTIHDVIFKMYPQYYKPVDRLIYQYKTAYACKNADIVIATSEQTKEDLVKYFKADAGKIEVVHQVCSPSFSIANNNLEKKSPPVILYLSSFQNRKNHLRLIEAFAKVSAKTGMNLLLAGRPGETFISCESLVRKFGIIDRIKFMTNINSAQMPDVYATASAFIYPSEFEGFGIPLLEAIQCHLPVACSNISVFKEIVGDAALYFNPLDINSISEAILRLENKEENVIAYNKIIHNFSDTVVAERLNGVYERLKAKY
ncbi:MAG: glycosyltransferase family 4 protein [Bacteroidia bacterium]|nr:glycosyltransferase family 4 protein [Bacteroidia bacterium]